MKSLADGLPPDIAKQLHPDLLRNEAEYWAVRDQLLSRYQDQWIGFADGQVVASGRSPVEVLHAAQKTGRHPFFICVGKEDEPTRIRRATFGYDTQYSREPLPIMTVEFRPVAGLTGVMFDRVIPDTGADASVLPWADCQQLQLSPATAVFSLISGVTGTPTATIEFNIWARLDGQDHQCRVQVDFSGQERILGRDVLNRLDILLRGPANEVVVNP